jgi:DNA-binding MarR family transcriptional regulator
MSTRNVTPARRGRSKSRSVKPLPSKLAGPRESPGFLLWRVSNAWQRRQRTALRPFGLSHSQFVLLATAAWYGEQELLTQARLAELSGVDVMTTSQIVRTLLTAGLLSRGEHPDDSRANVVAVTPAGRARASAAITVVEQVDEAFFAPVARTAAPLLALLQALDLR